MHGLMFKAAEGYVTANHGAELWTRVTQAVGIPFDRFHSMRSYDPDLMVALMDAISHELGRSPPAVMEDIGHWICVHPPLDGVRRLIRFGGPSFEDLILSLDDMRGRVRMALPDLELPTHRVRELGNGEYEIDSEYWMLGVSAVTTGMLRAMADDYGTLAVIRVKNYGCIDGVWHETVSVSVVDPDFQAPRDFRLSGAA
ncbi:heme NO-binding domain-containing protein [uncultured Jannaschia sp.]|uniref:heme NO-binding domain-containing protein n=1 Tax=uncultured Jannaschia sp. TaxID=293347 RepID=UPI002619E271|nr:heme NO-binding domain-containing protein [uncultured Jannaschia sp.]